MDDYLPLVVMFVLAVGFVLLSITASKLLAPSRSTVAKEAPYECGIVPSREPPERFPVTFQVMRDEGMESLCAMPLVSGERCRAVLFFMAARRAAYEGLRRDFLAQVAGAVAIALDDCLAHEEVRELRDRLAAENVYLQEEIQHEHNFAEIIGHAPELRQVLSRVCCPRTSPVPSSRPACPPPSPACAPCWSSWPAPCGWPAWPHALPARPHGWRSWPHWYGASSASWRQRASSLRLRPWGQRPAWRRRPRAWVHNSSDSQGR